jgi:hypothetical protein
VGGGGPAADGADPMIPTPSVDSGIARPVADPMI